MIEYCAAVYTVKCYKMVVVSYIVDNILASIDIYNVIMYFLCLIKQYILLHIYIYIYMYTSCTHLSESAVSPASGLSRSSSSVKA